MRNKWLTVLKTVLVPSDQTESQYKIADHIKEIDISGSHLWSDCVVHTDDPDFLIIRYYKQGRLINESIQPWDKIEGVWIQMK
jgi:hypothetical protein